MTERPMWCDDFDMDLPKVLPEARGMLGDLADVVLFTTGGTTHGTLNHPSVWNGDKSMLAFFGFRHAPRSSFYVTDKPEVRCTAWEAFRDAWPHNYAIIVEGLPTWDTTHLFGPVFQDIMFHRRGWREQQTAHDAAIKALRKSLTRGIEKLRHVIELHRVSA